jgi:hypothetical protein
MFFCSISRRCVRRCSVTSTPWKISTAPSNSPWRGGVGVDLPRRPWPRADVLLQDNLHALPQRADGGIFDRLAGPLVDEVENVRQWPTARLAETPAD